MFSSDLSGVAAAPPPPTNSQPNYLLDGEVIADLSGTGKTVTNFGGITLSSAATKFGSVSYAYSGAANSYLALSASDDLAFGTGDFTVECWIYFATTVGGSSIFEMRPNQSPWATISDYWVSNRYHLWINGGNPIAGAATLTTGVWYHLAICRVGTTLRTFINGVLDGTATNHTVNYINAGAGVQLGRHAGGTTLSNGTYIDGVRIIKGTGLYSENFTPPTTAFSQPGARQLDYLVVAGGGGGGGPGGLDNYGGGGGGAGGMLTGTTSLMANTPYAVRVGAGGAGGPNNGGSTSGNDSVLGSIFVAVGGGGGGTPNNATHAAGKPGGSGGGAAMAPGPTGTAGGTGVSGQGNAGGAPFVNAGTGTAGGGGGASSAGSAGSSSQGGNGGNGLSSSITGAAVVYAGGGGAGAKRSSTPGSGGTGGGGIGSGAGSGAAGAGGVNLGGGGGGGSFAVGANGGSGVVVIRLPSTAAAAFSAGVTVSQTVDGSFLVYRVTATSTTNETVTIS